jgi:hypothetical protein
VFVFRYNQNAVVFRVREWIELNVWSRRESVVKVNFKLLRSSDCLSYVKERVTRQRGYSDESTVCRYRRRNEVSVRSGEKRNSGFTCSKNLDKTNERGLLGGDMQVRERIGACAVRKRGVGVAWYTSGCRLQGTKSLASSGFKWTLLCQSRMR